VARKVDSCGASKPFWRSSFETVPLSANVSAAVRTIATPRVGRVAGRAFVRVLRVVT
jgi:hypothetical protein